MTRHLAIVAFMSTVIVAACKKSTEQSSDSGSPAPVVQTRPAIKVMAEVADAIGTIKDKASLDAARPRLKALEPRYQEHRPVLVAAAYLSKKAVPGLSPKEAAQLVKLVEQDPQIQPYLAEARALMADPAFAATQQRYIAALRQAGSVPGGPEAILPLQVEMKR